MQDSIELPSDEQFKQESHQQFKEEQQQKQINFFVSPNNSQRKFKHINFIQAQKFNTGSQESLAYSSQTHAKYQYTERSPIEVQVPNFETSEKPQKLTKMMYKNKVGTTHKYSNTVAVASLKQTQSQDQLDVQRHGRQPMGREDGRKTISKQYRNLSSRYKQLQYAHQIQLINSEQLRTKVAILTQLLQQKLKQSQFAYILKLKNSSKNLNNIDIFMELKQNTKKVKQYELIVEQLKLQIQKYKDNQKSKNVLDSKKMSKQREREREKQNMNTANSTNMNNYNYLQQKIEQLTQEKQSLFNYIQQMRKQYNKKITEQEDAQKELKHYKQKQYKYTTLERPKFIQEITQRTQKIKQLQQQVEKLRMERNLLQLNYQNQIQELKNTNRRHQLTEMTGKEIGINTNQTITGCKQVQTDEDHSQHAQNNKMQLMKAELKLLKQQRDYYIQEYKKRVAQGTQNYLLKMQLQNYQSFNLVNH